MHPPSEEPCEGFPALSPRLWEKMVARFKPIDSTYLRKFGISGGAPVTTIDSFFQVNVKGRGVTASPPAESEDQGCLLQFLTLDEARDPSVQYTDTEPGRCDTCDVELQHDFIRSQIYCPGCGNCVHDNLLHHYGTGNFSRQQRATTYMYKRTNHFNDHMKRVQAKESAGLRPDVLAAVREELKKERIEEGDPAITTTKVRQILKKRRLQKHYNHEVAITSRLSGKSAPMLTTAQEEKLLTMFQMIQEPFDRHCPQERTNMLSYTYLLRKMCEILQWHDLVQYFPLLKSEEKVFLQDKLWKKICDDLQWPFYRSTM